MPPKGPFPRTYTIEITGHAKARQAERGVSDEAMEDTIRTGGEAPQPGIGGNGGRFVKFTKGSVVVIGEICDNVCHVLTTYHAS
jgi:hypothetical protein